MATNARLIYGQLSRGATATATNTATGYTPASAVDLDRASQWRGSTGTPINLTLDLLTAKTVGGLCIANHNLATLAGEGATYGLRASTDNFAASDVFIAAFDPTAILALGNVDYYKTFTPASYRYWRGVFENLGATKPHIGEFYLGTLLTLAENPKVNAGEVDVAPTFRSRRFSGRSVVKSSGRLTRRFDFTFGPFALAATEAVRTAHAAQGGDLYPCFYVPQESGSPTEGRAYMVRLPRELEVRQLSASYYDMDLPLEEEQ